MRGQPQVQASTWLPYHESASRSLLIKIDPDLGNLQKYEWPVLHQVQIINTRLCAPINLRWFYFILCRLRSVWHYKEQYGVLGRNNSPGFMEALPNFNKSFFMPLSVMMSPSAIVSNGIVVLGLCPTERLRFKNFQTKLLKELFNLLCLIITYSTWMVIKHGDPGIFLLIPVDLIR